MGRAPGARAAVVWALGAASAVLVAACGTNTGGAAGASAAGSGSFPVTVVAANGAVRLATRPHAVVSLSPTATEMLFAIGAGDQVKAVDKDSDYPKRAPHTSLDGYQPNVEAIAAYRPDLVVMAGDTTGLVGQLHTLGIPVVSLPAASTLNDTYDQLTTLGRATGHGAQAAAEITSMKSQIAAIVRGAHGASTIRSYYYELDPTYYTVTSATFVGHVLGLLGLRSVADAAPGSSSSGGYPQLSSEYIVHADPDVVFLADTLCCGQDAQKVGARPGWSTIRAVQAHHVVALNDDVASRWGPRVVDLLRAAAGSLEASR